MSFQIENEDENFCFFFVQSRVRRRHFKEEGRILSDDEG